MNSKLQKLLDYTGAKYQLIPHDRTYTALETAEATHVGGKELAKSVILRVDGALMMVVLPATHYVDLDYVQLLTGADMVDLADEHEFSHHFADCELRAMPPFGRLYGMQLYVDEKLAEDAEIVFDAGTHTEAVKMSFADYFRLAEPILQRVSMPRPALPL